MEGETQQDESVMISALSIDNLKSKNKEQSDLHQTDIQSESGYSSLNDNCADPSSSGFSNNSHNQSNESKKEFDNLDYVYVTYIAMALYESPTERKLKFDKICEYIKKKLPLCQLEGTINVEDSVEKNLHACKSFVKIPDENDKSGVDCYWMLSPDFKNTHLETIIVDLVKIGAFMEAFNGIEDFKPSIGVENKNSAEMASKSTFPKLTQKSVIHNFGQKESVFLPTANDEKGLSYFNQQLWILRMIKLGILNPLPTSLPPLLLTPDVPLMDENISYSPEEDDSFQEEEDDDFKEAVVDLQDQEDDEEEEEDFQDDDCDCEEEEEEEEEEDDDDYEDPY